MSAVHVAWAGEGPKLRAGEATADKDYPFVFLGGNR